MFMKKIFVIFLLLWIQLFSILACRSSSETGKGTDSSFTAKEWNRYSYSERRGKALYDHYCSHCHGFTGKGDGPNAIALDTAPRDLADSTYVSALPDTALKKEITFGGTNVLMPSFSHTLNDDEISFIVDYIRTLSNLK